MNNLKVLFILITASVATTATAMANVGVRCSTNDLSVVGAPAIPAGFFYRSTILDLNRLQTAKLSRVLGSHNATSVFAPQVLAETPVDISYSNNQIILAAHGDPELLTVVLNLQSVPGNPYNPDAKIFKGSLTSNQTLSSNGSPALSTEVTCEEFGPSVASNDGQLDGECAKFAAEAALNDELSHPTAASTPGAASRISFSVKTGLDVRVGRSTYLVGLAFPNPSFWTMKTVEANYDLATQSCSLVSVK